MDRPIAKGFSRLDPWDPTIAPEVIKQIETETIARVDWYIKWYQDNKKIKSSWSKVIRSTCVIFFVSTALIPVLKSIYSWVQIEYGYLLSGIASGLLFFDKFYGFSTGWIRYNNALASLGNAKRDFQKIMQDAVLLHPANTPEGFQALVDTIRAFDDNVSTIIQTETDEWSKEFRAGNDELQAYFKEQTNQQKPGDVQINITDYTVYTNIELSLNGVSKGFVIGGSKLLNSLPPDNYTVTVKASSGNNVITKTAIISVKTNQLVVIDIKLV